MARMRLLNTAKTPQVEGFCIIKSVQAKTNVKGSAYLDVVLLDSEGEIDAKLWDYQAEQHGVYEDEQIVKIRGTVQLWKDVEQLRIDKMRAVTESDDVDMRLLVPCAPFDAEWMYDALYETAENFEDVDIKLLTQYMLRTNKPMLLKAPAAVKLHHATRSGLLHHTMSILNAAKAICPLYPLLNADLLYAGVILHDIAKIKEMRVGALGLANSYSMEGQLLGHISIGVSDIAAAAELLQIEGETPLLLQHMILSHHGQPEYGSPKYPMFPEAEMLSLLDLLDARMYEMFDTLSGIQAGGFSERVWALDNRQLYQHGK